MQIFPRKRLSVAIAAALGVAGCSPEPTIEYEPYTGSAYPNRATPIAWPLGGAALVTNSYGDTVSVIDLAKGAPFFTRPVGRNPVDLDGPHHIVTDPSGAYAFIALSYPRINATGPHAAHGSASIPGYVQKLSLVDLSVVGSVRVENNPGDIVISPDGKKIVVSHFDLERAVQNPGDVEKARASIAIVDPEGIAPSGSTRPTFVTTCVAPHGVAFAPGSNRAFVSCYGEDALAIVDIDHPETPIERIPVAANVSGFGSPKYGPYAGTTNSAGTRIAVSSTESRDVRFFDIATKTFDATSTITLVGAPYFSAWSDDDQTLFVPTQDPDAIVAVTFDGSDPKSTTFTADQCRKPHVVTRVGTSLYLVCEGDHTTPGSLVVLDASLAVVSSQPLGLYPDAFAVVPPKGAP